MCIPTFYGTLDTTLEEKRTSVPAGFHVSTLNPANPHPYHHFLPFNEVLTATDPLGNTTTNQTKLEERDYAETGVWTLRAPMLALSNPDPALAFPPGTTLHPQLFVRNTTGKPNQRRCSFQLAGGSLFMLEDALGGLPLRVWVLQGWDILRFASLLSFSVSLLPLSVHGIDANQSWFILGVEQKTGRVVRSGSLEKFWVPRPRRVAHPSCSKMPWVVFMEPTAATDQASNRIPTDIDLRDRNHSFEDLACFNFALVGFDPGR